MRRFFFSGYGVEVDDELGRFTWWVKWYSVVLISLFHVIVAWMCLVWPVGCLVAEVRGQVSGGEGLVGLWLAVWWAFVAFIWVMFTVFFVAGVCVLWNLLDFLLFGTRTYALDRWNGRFRLGRRDLCALDRISAVCLDLEEDNEGGTWYNLRFRLKDGRDLSAPHFTRLSVGGKNVGRFVAELTAFLDVPVMKAAPAGFKGPVPDLE
jgi:hypothetical protein